MYAGSVLTFVQYFTFIPTFNDKINKNTAFAKWKKKDDFNA